jgi:adhesin HecA-like repeat protein
MGHATTGTATVTVNTGATFTTGTGGTTLNPTATLNLPGGTFVANGTVNIRSGGTLNVSGDGMLNLTDENLIAQNGDVGEWNGSNYTGLTGLICSGRNGGAPGALWQGGGLVTTMSDAAASSILTTLGIATAAQANKTSFAGITVSGTDVLVMYTYAGDANLSGAIDGDDFARIDDGYSQSLAGYFNGDFDYSGKVDADDYWLISRSFARQAAAFSGSLPSSLQAVPEPACLFALALPLLAQRRRR